MDVTLTQLRYFVEAARQLSMTRAAQRLNVAQSAVSTAVSELERHVGSKFFIRQRSKGLILTPEGELFLLDAQGVLTQMEEVLDRARGEQQSLEGRLRMACFSTLAPFLLPGLLVRVQEEYPKLTVDVQEADTGQCVAALLAGQVDLALCYEMDLPETIAATSVASSRPYVLLPGHHPLASRRGISLRDLRDEPFILLDLPHTRDLMLSILRTAGIEPNIRFRTGGYETLRTFVANGHGFSILHQRPHHNNTYDGEATAVVEIKEDVPELNTVLAHVRGQRVSARMRAVAQTLRKQLAGAPAGAA